MTAAPPHLPRHDSLTAREPREAARAWFREARYGLFVHYGLYSILGRHEWVQYRERIPVAEYAKLKERFTAERFDADAIAELALEAGMKYVNLTTRHHECFSLFETAQSDFQSMNSPAKRDLVAELAAACEKRGMGLFFYYTHGRDWKHPHAPNNDEWSGFARPAYDPPEPSYAYGEAHNLQIYLDFMTEHIRELLTNYGPVAGIWLDGVAVPLSGDREKFRCGELYDLVRSMQPQVLVSYKQGLLGTEDFFAPEHKRVERPGPVEICTTMCPAPREKYPSGCSWGYLAEGAGTHKSAAEVWETLRAARAGGANLLLNTGLLPDGSLDEEDAIALRTVGERLRREGFPGEA